MSSQLCRSMPQKTIALIVTGSLIAGVPAMGIASWTMDNQEAYASGAAQKGLSQAQRDADKAAANLNRAKSDKVRADSELSRSKSAYSQAGKNRQRAQERVDAARKTLDAAKGDVESAQQDHDRSAEQARDAAAAQVETNQQLEAAQKAENEAKEALDAAERQRSSAKEQLDRVNAEASEKQTAYETASSKAQASAKASTEAAEAVVTAKSDNDAAKSTLFAAQADEFNAKSALDFANAVLKDKQAAYQAAEAKRAQGSKGFFEDHGSTAAASALTNARYASSTNLGAKGDATSLDNMKRTFQFLKECNEIRVNDGLTPLKVTDSMMAYAQSDANWSVDNIGHAQQFNVGENLSWGYGSRAYVVGAAGNAESYSNPFCGWYDAEKAIYDSGTTDFSKTGHYQNIVNETYAVTGFAVTDGGDYGVCYGQTFNRKAPNGEKAYTVAEYEQLFNAYIASIEASETEYQAAQRSVANAQNVYDQAASATKTAQQNAGRTGQALTEKQFAAQTASSDAASAASAEAEARASLDSAQSSVRAAQTAYDAAARKAASASDAEAKTNADLATKQKAADKANKRASDAKKDESASKDKLDRATKDESDAESELSDAKAALDKAERAEEAARTDVIEKQDAADAAAKKVEKAQTLKNQADKALAQQTAGETPADKRKTHSASSRKTVAKVTVNAKNVTAGTVKKAIGKHAKTVKTVIIGKKVKTISSKAFTKVKRVTALEVTSKKLTKKGVKGSLKGSKVKTIWVKVGSASQNKKYVKTYKKYFAKGNSGKKVAVKTK